MVRMSGVLRLPRWHALIVAMQDVLGQLSGKPHFYVRHTTFFLFALSFLLVFSFVKFRNKD